MKLIYGGDNLALVEASNAACNDDKMKHLHCLAVQDGLLHLLKVEASYQPKSRDLFINTLLVSATGPYGLH
jgi:hypothetical protein